MMHNLPPRPQTPGTASETPLTDAACHGFVQLNPQKTDVDMWSIQCVDADFARSLEVRLRKAEGLLQLAQDAVVYNGHGSPSVDQAAWEAFDAFARRLLEGTPK